MHLKKLHLTLLSVAIVLNINACSIASEVIHHDENDQQLLKADALDVPVRDVYDTYQYKFLDKYKISHQFLRVSGCSYWAVGTLGVKDGYNGEIWDVKDIFEQNNHTYQRSYPRKDVNQLNPSSIDFYVRPEFDRGLDPYGNPLPKGKGFQPMCFESWGGTSHVLSIKLYKKDLAIWKNDLAQINPNGKFSEEIIGGNQWLVQTNDIGQRAFNGTGGAYLHYSTAIGNTGYTLTIQLGANQDSLKYPKAHAQMQAIFKHLIESVKIEPIKP